MDPCAPDFVDQLRVAVHPRLPSSLTEAWAQGPLLVQVTGSRLHGFASTHSDVDAWVVVPEPRDHRPGFRAPRVAQVLSSVDDTTVDVTVVGLSTFGVYAERCVPTALEALFASTPSVNTLGGWRAAFRAGTEATSTYRRYLTLLAATGHADAKLRRHAFRLALNLNELRTSGRFNPTLSPDDRGWVLEQAADPDQLPERLAACVGVDVTPDAARL